MKMDDFKEFVKNKPFLKKKVDNGDTSWQELYEHYDLYGEDDEIFQEPKTKQKAKSKDDGLSHFFDLLGDIDVDKITDGLNGMKKILSILSEVSESEDASKRKMHHSSRGED